MSHTVAVAHHERAEYILGIQIPRHIAAFFLFHFCCGMNGSFFPFCQDDDVVIDARHVLQSAANEGQMTFFQNFLTDVVTDLQQKTAAVDAHRHNGQNPGFKTDG